MAESRTTSLTPLIIQAANIFYSCFARYVPAFIFDLKPIDLSNLNSLQFVYKKPFGLKGILGSMIIFVCLLSNFLIIFVFAKKKVWPETVDLNEKELMTLLMVLTFGVNTVFLLFAMVRDSNIVGMYNFFIANDRNFQFLHRNRTNDLPGTLLLVYSLGAIFMVPIVPIFLSLMDSYDPTYIVLDKLFLPHPYQRDVQQIVLAKLISLLFSFSALTIFLRTLGVLFMIILAGFVSIEAYLLTLLSGNNNRMTERLIIQEYQQVLAVFKTGSFAFSQIWIILVEFTLVTLILLAWFFLNCFTFLPAFVLLTILFGYTLELISTVCVLKHSADIREKSVFLVQTKRSIFHRTKRLDKELHQLWKAAQPLPIKCGDRFVVGKDAVTNYWTVLIENTVDVVMLIDIKQNIVI